MGRHPTITTADDKVRNMNALPSDSKRGGHLYVVMNYKPAFGNIESSSSCD